MPACFVDGGGGIVVLGSCMFRLCLRLVLLGRRGAERVGGGGGGGGGKWTFVVREVTKHGRVVKQILVMGHRIS